MMKRCNGVRRQPIGSIERARAAADAAAEALGARYTVTPEGIDAQLAVDASSSTLQLAMVRSLWRRVAALERQVRELTPRKPDAFCDD